MLNVQELIDLLELPSVRVRSMFKSMFFFSNGIPFCLLNQGKVYIRVSLRYRDLLVCAGVEPLCYKKSNSKGKIRTRYFLLPDYVVNDTKRLNRLLKKAYQLSQVDSNKNHRQRLRDLPNLQLKHERILKSIKINSVEKLKLIGAEQAYRRLKIKNPEITVDLYFKLKGAIEGKHAFLIKQCLIRNNGELVRNFGGNF